MKTQIPAAGAVLTVDSVTPVTITITDGAGNQATCTTSVTVADQTPPVIMACPPDRTLAVDAACEATLPDLMSSTVATDNCTAPGDLLKTQSPPPGTVLALGVVTPVTVTVADAAGNQATCTVNIMATDQTAPAIVSCPADRTLAADAACAATIPDLASSTAATDNCTSAGDLVKTQNPAAGTVLALNSVIPVTVTIADASGNEATCIVNLTATDQTAPVIAICPPDQTLAADAACGATVPDLVIATAATDNCTPAGDLVITQNPPVGTPLALKSSTPIIVTIRDTSGNTATCTANLTVTDQTAPVITSCPPDRTIAADAGCAATVPDMTSAVTAADNCSSPGELVKTQDPAAGMILAVDATTPVTITVRDAAGNATACTVNVTVTDQTAPVIATCPPDRTLAADAACETLVPDLTSAITARDNCTATGDLRMIQNPSAGTAIGLGTPTSVTVTVSDAAGNAADCVVHLTAVDITPPLIHCLADKVVESSDTWTFDEPSASDSCTGTGVTIAVIDTVTNATGFCLGTFQATRTWRAMDADGNSATCSQTVLVVDTQAPILQCRADKVVECGSVWSFDEPAATDAGSGTNVLLEIVSTVTNQMRALTAYDRASAPREPVPVVSVARIVEARSGLLNRRPPNKPAPATVRTRSAQTQKSVPVSPLLPTANATSPTVSPPAMLTVTRTWVATDGCGNQATCQQTITVADTTPPVISGCPSDLTLGVDALCVAAIPDLASSTAATDNCTASGDLVKTQHPPAGTVVMLGAVTPVTITIADAAGNETTCTVTVTTADQSAPLITACPPDRTLAVDAACESVVPDLTSSTAATDNCTPSGDLAKTQSPAAGSVLAVNSITQITITIADATGNKATCVVNVTATDQSAPEITTCPPNQTLAADAACAATIPDLASIAAATDNCTPTEVLVKTQNPPAGTEVTLATITPVTIIIADTAGNESTCTVNLVVADQTAPVITTCPPDRTLAADAACQATVPDLTSASVATDNCTAAGALVTTQYPAAGTTLALDSVTPVTVTIADAAGNEATCIAMVTVTDQTPPAVTACPPDRMIAVDAACKAAMPDFTSGITATDNCTATADLVRSQSPPPGSILALGVITPVAVAVADANGNQATCTVNVIATDQTSPVITTCPPDSTLAADVACQATVPDLSSSVEVADNCTAAGNMVMTQNPPAGTALALNSSTPVTITVMDASGNAANCRVNLTAVDVTPPVVSYVADKVVESGVAWTFDEPTATDACDGTDVTITVSDTVTNSAGFCFGTYQTTRTWRAMDAAGNSASCSQTVTVVDTTAPILQCQADKIVECGTVWNFEEPMASDAGSGTNVSVTVVSTVTNQLQDLAVSDRESILRDPVPVVSVVRALETRINPARSAPSVIRRAATAGAAEAFLSAAADNSANALLERSSKRQLPRSSRRQEAQVSSENRIVSAMSEPLRLSSNKPVPATARDYSARTQDSPSVSRSLSMTVTMESPATSPSAVFIVTRTWVASDACGNQATCQQTVTVADTAPPLITGCPTDRTIAVDDDCEAIVPDLTSDTAATDNCTIDGALVTTQNPAAGTALTPGLTTPVTITVRDLAGNAATCTVNVFVADQTAPTFTDCPADRTITADTICGATVPNLLSAAIATDNCTPAGNLMKTQNPLAGTALALDSVTSVTITMADAAGNEASCAVLITVKDETAPVIAVCPSDQTIAVNATCDAVVPNLISSTVVSDNCTPAGDLRKSQNPPAGTALVVGVATPVTVTVADAAGNAANCVVKLTAADTTPPVIHCQADKVVESGAAWAFDEPTATDACAGAVGNVVVIGTVTNSTGFCSGTYQVIRTWQAEDAAGNRATCSQTVTVRDTTAPLIVCQENKVVECGTAWTFDAPTATDAGSGTTVVIEVVSTATNQPQTLTAVEDVLARRNPNKTAPPSVRELPVLTPESLPASRFVPTVSRLASPAIIPEAVFTVTRTWAATDACGNRATCSQTVTVVDTAPPAIVCPSDRTFACDAPIVFDQASALDACDPNPVITWTDVESPGECPVAKRIMREWTATDASGNLAVCRQMITINCCPQPCLAMASAVACLLPDDNCGTFAEMASGIRGDRDPGFCYRITVQNCGAVPINNLSVLDDQMGDLTGEFFPASNAVLAPNESVTRYLKMAWSQDTTNTVTASGQSVLDGRSVANHDSSIARVLVGRIATQVTVTSPADTDGNGADNQVRLPHFGGPYPVTFKVIVCNSGAIDLANVLIQSAELEDCVGNSLTIPALATGECGTNQCTLEVACPGAITANVNVTAEATGDVCGYDFAGAPVVVTGQGAGRIECEAEPAFLLSGEAASATVEPGSRTAYFYAVTNDGAVTLTDLVVVDDNGTPDYPADDRLVGSLASLPPGGAYEFMVEAIPPITYCDNTSGLESGRLISMVLPDGNIQVTFLESPSVSDNTYGINAQGWGKKAHKFNDLVGSDKAGFLFTDTFGRTVLEFTVDYLSKSPAFPSGYGTLGVSGGDGKVKQGEAASILQVGTSLTENLNQPPFLERLAQYTVDSPAPDDPNLAAWQDRVIYSVVVDRQAFEPFGFGSVTLKDQHNSPAKISIKRPAPCGGCVTNLAIATAHAGNVLLTRKAATVICLGSETPVAGNCPTKAPDWGKTPSVWPSEYTPDQTVLSVFDQAAVLPEVASKTLLEAVKGKAGGGKVKDILKEGVAGLLNAASPDVAYPFSSVEIVLGVNTALASGDNALQDELKKLFEAANKNDKNCVKAADIPNCDTVGKPNVLTLMYEGLSCEMAANSQMAFKDKTACAGDPAGAPWVRVVVTDRSMPPSAKDKIFFDDVVALGQTFEVFAATAGKKDFGANLYFYLYDGATLVQSIQMHTSCSAPLQRGDTFGGLLLEDYRVEP